MIPYGRQSISDEDIEAVVAVLKSDFLTTGPKIQEFEEAVAQYCGAQYAIAVSNATAALHLCARALDLGNGDYLWTSPNTFVASANAAEHCGGRADFCDIDPESLNLSAIELERKLYATPKEKHPKVLIPVHFAGQPCDMKRIYELSKEFGFRIVEDAAHALGSSYDGQKIGSCQYSDMTVFSFHPVKNITSGEGGMITTNDAALADHLRRLRSIGVTRDKALMTQEYPGAWYYEQLEFGLNYRLTDISAALGLSQLRRIDDFVKRRNEIFDRYNRELAGLPLKLPKLMTGDRSAWHLYVIQITEKSTVNRAELFNALRERNIGVNVHYIPVHLQPIYRAYGFKPGDFPRAENYYAYAISLPIFYDFKESEQSYVIEQLTKLLS